MNRSRLFKLLTRTLKYMKPGCWCDYCASRDVKHLECHDQYGRLRTSVLICPKCAKVLGNKLLKYSGAAPAKVVVEDFWKLLKVEEPNTADHVIVSLKDGTVCEADYGVIKYCAERGNEESQKFLDQIVAWMPKPASFKEEA